MSGLNLYGANIAVILIFTSFLNLVLPGGRYKDYIKLVTGLMVILVIISPVAEFLNSGGIEGLFNQAERELSMSITGKEKPYYDDGMIKTVMAVYREDIASGLEKKLAEYGYEAESIFIDIDESDENFGLIRGIRLVVSKREVVKEEKSNFIKVDKIRIEPIGGESRIGGDSPEIKTLKNFISGFYNLSVENIYIEMR